MIITLPDETPKNDFKIIKNSVFDSTASIKENLKHLVDVKGDLFSEQKNVQVDNAPKINNSPTNLKSCSSFDVNHFLEVVYSNDTKDNDSKGKPFSFQLVLADGKLNVRFFINSKN